MGFPGGLDSKESTCSAGDLSWEDPLEEGTANHSSILAWRIPMDRGAWQATWRRKELDTTKRLRTHTHTAETNTILYSNYPLIKNE